MQIRNTPIRNFEFDQERVDKLYDNWKKESVEYCMIERVEVDN
jgi:hypothetical protein